MARAEAIIAEKQSSVGGRRSKTKGKPRK